MTFRLLPAVGIFLLVAGVNPRSFGAEKIELSWTNNLLTVRSAKVPGGELDIWYLEAFCRHGAAHRDWGQTILPHKTTLLSSEPGLLRFRTAVEPHIQVLHEARAVDDGVEFDFDFTNSGPEKVDLQWFEPACVRVQTMTGADQDGYISRSFIFTTNGLVTLDRTRRASEALYKGGQVYGMPGISPDDLNPRPLSADVPTNGLIGCFSKDNRTVLAICSDQTHELFQGVYVCLHSDPSINGLAPGAVKHSSSKLYLLDNDIPQLLRHYRRDFPGRNK